MVKKVTDNTARGKVFRKETNIQGNMYIEEEMM
jgi:hypothetical protein